jgi:hypothetical protein
MRSKSALSSFLIIRSGNDDPFMTSIKYGSMAT